MKVKMKVKVYLNSYNKKQFVGLLHEDEKKRIYFEYNADFIKSGIELSPFKLPLQSGIFEDKDYTFNGLYGLFNDSLPDGWGCLLIDKALKKERGLSYAAITPLTRLSYAGITGMGALEYEPIYDEISYTESALNLDTLAHEIQNIIAELPSSKLDELITLNASANGARPKILVNVSHDKKNIISGMQSKNLKFSSTPYNTCSPWIIKFSAENDSKNHSKNLGIEEYVYSLMAKKAGIEMPETYLFPSKKCAGYFGVKRFDRIGQEKIHIHSACGLLHASHRYSSIDYETLLKLTWTLTKNKEDLLKVFRLMIFNVKSCNKDDHTKNFSFLLDRNNTWHFAPAYDITPTLGRNNEQTLAVNGKGIDITKEDFIQVGEKFSIERKNTLEIIEEIDVSLAEYQKLLKEYS